MNNQKMNKIKNNLMKKRKKVIVKVWIILIQKIMFFVLKIKNEILILISKLNYVIKKFKTICYSYIYTLIFTILK